MTTLREKQDELIRKAWEMMPPPITAPEDYTFFVWSKSDPRDLLFAIERTSKKMRKLIYEGETVTTERALQYTNSVLSSRAQWRKSVERRGQ